MITDKDITVIIIGSKLEDLTQQTIKSIQKTSECPIIVLRQSYRNYLYHFNGIKNIEILEAFNYNRYANNGILEAKTNYFVIANNDLIFEKNWTQAIKENFDTGAHVISPKEPNDKRQTDINTLTIGWQCGKHFSGWCFALTLQVWKEIKGFDEDFPFWCADNSFLEQLKILNDPLYTPVITPKSIVRHLGSQTLKTLNIELQNDLTKEQVKKFNRKYNQNLFNLGK